MTVHVFVCGKQEKTLQVWCIFSTLYCSTVAEPFEYSHTLTMSHQHSCPPPPNHFPSLPALLPLLVCIPLYYSIHCICCSRYPGRNSAAARPCDQPNCCPDAFSALFQQRKTSWWQPWRQADYSVPSIPSQTRSFAIGSWQEPTFSIFTSPHFFRSF